MPVTASHLYAYVSCPHRVWRDQHDDSAERDEVNEFVQMLWEKGTQHERQVIDAHRHTLNVMDLSGVPRPERFAPTFEALNRGAPYIYQGRLEVDDLIGEPDLLERQPDGSYVPGDIKSGMGLEGDDEDQPGRPKKHYAIQLCLYVDALRRLGFADHHTGKIWDSRGHVLTYHLDAARGSRTPQTWWEWYQEALVDTRAILSGTRRTDPALGGVCKLCPWYTSCKRACVEANDLSLIHELGRSRRDGLRQIALDVTGLAVVDPTALVGPGGKTGIDGIGVKSLEKFAHRAKLLRAGGTKPVILNPFSFPDRPIELYFDIEADPTRDIVYLHGVVERRDGAERFHSFVAADVTAEAEERAWRQFWGYVRGLPRADVAVYYYSKYERTQYRRLREKYPDVATADEVEAFFDPAFAIDLYFDVVLRCTDWPTHNYSVKTLAQLQGFRWRDPHPSGAASIQWFNEWCGDRDPAKLQRILDYNEDDCRAMRVLKDVLLPYASRQ